MPRNLECITSQIGLFPQVGVKIDNIQIHHLDCKNLLVEQYVLSRLQQNKEQHIPR